MLFQTEPTSDFPFFGLLIIVSFSDITEAVLTSKSVINYLTILSRLM